MKKNTLVLCGLSLLLLGACATTKNKTAKNTTSISSVELHRTNCFGKCPDYRLRMMADGSVTYVGRRHAPYQGTFEKKLTAEQVQGLFKEFERFRADTAKETYQTIPDLPGMDLEIVYADGKEKNIKNGGSPFAPKFLMGLAERMDALAPIDGTWKKTESWEEPQN
jgi:hypothetical protein